MFTKCSNLSNVVELFLSNDLPLIVKYKVTTLGEIKLCLASHNMSNEWFYNFQEDYLFNCCLFEVILAEFINS